MQGIFPFKEAKKDEYFYNLILNGKIDQYWSKVGGQNLSEEFKDLILKMFSYDGAKRPTIEELKNHPWMPKPMDLKHARSTILDKLSEIRSAKTADSSRESGSSRGDQMLELVRQASEHGLERYRFNDVTDHDIDVVPGVFWDELNTFNADCFDSKFTIENNLEKKWMKMSMEDKENGGAPLVVKVKFFNLEGQAEGDDADAKRRLRVRFTKKRGDLLRWYEIFNMMKDSFEDLLLATKNQQNAEGEE